MSEAPALQDRVRAVRTILAEFTRAIVAFSGGVDSTLLLSLSMEALGASNVLAVTADSPSLSRRDLDDARRLARELGARHLVVDTHELEDPSYRANAGNRCYLCKRTLFVELDELARQLRMPVILYGAIGDDVAAERPGQRAASEHGVRAPLQEAGLAKWDVRELARLRGLSNWEKPQDACLSSRIPHGQSVTVEKLRQVEIAEEMLVSLGFHHVRVRHIGAHARVEVGQEEVDRLEDAGLRRTIADRLSALGFRSMSVSRYVPGGADRPAPERWVIAEPAHTDGSLQEGRLAA